jgi:hypothetical protein
MKLWFEQLRDEWGIWRTYLFQRKQHTPRKGDQMSEDYMKYDGRKPEPPYPTSEDEIERLTQELAQAKEQLAAREARISEILSNLHQYKDDPFIEAAVRFTQDDLLILREHEAKVLKEAIQAVLDAGGDNADYHSDAIQLLLSEIS